MRRRIHTSFCTAHSKGMYNTAFRSLPCGQILSGRMMEAPRRRLALTCRRVPSRSNQRQWFPFRQEARIAVDSRNRVSSPRLRYPRPRRRPILGRLAPESWMGRMVQLNAGIRLMPCPPCLSMILCCSIAMVNCVSLWKFKLF